MSSEEYVPFVEGWDQERCPVEVSDNDFYATLTVKGENLTLDWIYQLTKVAYLNNGNENEATIGDIVDYEDGRFSFDVNFSQVFGEGDSVQFEVNGVKSSRMAMYKAN